MLDAYGRVDVARHQSYAPGEFPAHWHDTAYALHTLAWPAPWEGQLDRDRFIAELDSDHVDALLSTENGGTDGILLAYVKWKATENFHVSRDELSDPAFKSLPSAPPAAYVCAYEITATPDRTWRGLGRKLLMEALKRWERDHQEAVFCTYSPKRGLTTTLRSLAKSEQFGRPSLEVFAHRAGAAAARHIDAWIDRLEQPLDLFIRNEIVPTPDNRMMEHLLALSERYGYDVIDGVVAAMGIAYNFVLRARSGYPVCGPAAFHRALGAEHWRQYAASAKNCADALGLVDHWRYSHDPNRRDECSRGFKSYLTASADPSAAPGDLIVLA